MLVHDAARPCLTIELLQRLLETLDGDGVGGLLAVPVADTLKRSDADQRVVRTEAREGSVARTDAADVPLWPADPGARPCRPRRP